MLRIIAPDADDRAAAVERLCRRALAGAPEVEAAARRILDDVRARGDDAVREATARFEGRHLDRLELSAEEWAAAAARVAPRVRRAIEHAHARIVRFHQREHEALRGAGVAEHRDGDGVSLELRLRPLRRVGLYVPGGTARYPSSVLMTAVPARVAGVAEVVMVTPGPSDEALCAAQVAGVDRVFAIGGAQAVGALAYGTASVPRVDKIVGPGNAYVAAAKRLVFGEVDIDQVAGPSEVLVLADGDADPRLVAADLLAQAEHDADAWPVLATTSAELALAVERELGAQLATLPRRAIAERALAAHGVAVVFASLDEALAFCDAFAPEHLEVQCAIEREHLLERVPGAGAVFLGRHTPEAAGDYLAGPNHVLPTGGSARFGSPLGVHDFVRRMSVIGYSEEALARHAEDIVCLAEVEGLSAHGRAVTARFPGGLPGTRDQ